MRGATSALMIKASKMSAAPMAVSSGRSRVSKLLIKANFNACTSSVEAFIYRWQPKIFMAK